MLLKWLFKIRLSSYKNSSVRLTSLLLSLPACAFLIGPSLLTGIRQVTAAADSATTLAKLTSLFSSSFLLWVVAGAVFNFNVSWQVDLARVLRLPVRPSRVYAAKLIFGLVSPWLVLLFPVWVWLAWRLSASATGFLLVVIAILMFVVLTNAITGIVRLITGRVTRSWLDTLVLFLAIAVVNVFIFASLRALMMKDSSMLTRFSQALSSMLTLSLWDVLPGVIIAHAYHAAAEHNTQALLFSLLILVGAIAVAGSLELLMLKRTHLAGKPFTRARATARRSLLLRGLLRFGDRPGFVLLLKELRGLLTLKVVRVMLFIFASYLPIFVVFVPPPSFIFLFIFCTFPLMIFASVKSNLLGPEYGSIKSLFSMPIPLSEVIRVKSLAVNLMVGAVILETFVAGFIAGTITLTVLQASILLLYCCAVLTVWNILGSYCSIVSPMAMVQHNPEQADYFDPNAFLMVFGPPLVLVGFGIVHFVCSRAGRPFLELAICAALALIALGAYRLMYWSWFEAQVNARRESIYSRLLATTQ